MTTDDPSVYQKTREQIRAEFKDGYNKNIDPIQKILSYQHLLVYVAENFRCVYASEGLVTEIHCKLHGFVTNFPTERLESGELRMMQAIGAHMDQQDHDEWKKLGQEH